MRAVSINEASDIDQATPTATLMMHTSISLCAADELSFIHQGA